MGVDTNIIAAERALDTLNNEPIKGRPMRVMWSDETFYYYRSGFGYCEEPPLRDPSFSNIYIKNLDESIDREKLRDTFSAFGKILSCKVSSQIE